MNYVQIAQKAAHMTVALVVAERVESAVVDHTDLDSDSIAVQVGSMVVGQIVANKTDRFTDPIMEKASAKIASLKTKITKK